VDIVAAHTVVAEGRLAAHTVVVVDIGYTFVAGHSQVARRLAAVCIAVVAHTVVAEHSRADYIGRDRSVAADTVEMIALLVYNQTAWVVQQRLRQAEFHNWNKSVLLVRLDGHSSNKKREWLDCLLRGRSWYVQPFRNFDKTSCR